MSAMSEADALELAQRFLLADDVPRSQAPTLTAVVQRLAMMAMRLRREEAEKVRGTPPAPPGDQAAAGAGDTPGQAEG